MANSARGVMKISTENLDENSGLTEPVKGGGVAGQPYETIDSMQGVVQLDKQDDQHALVVIEQEYGNCRCKLSICRKPSGRHRDEQTHAQVIDLDRLEAFLL